MARRAAESIVKIEMAERRLDIVSPEQADDAPAEPDALGIAGCAGNHALRFRVFVDLVQLVLARRGGLVRRFAIRSLGKGWRGQTEQRGRKQPRRREQSAGDAQHTMGHWSDLGLGRVGRIAGTSPGPPNYAAMRRGSKDLSPTRLICPACSELHSHSIHRRLARHAAKFNARWCLAP